MVDKLDSTKLPPTGFMDPQAVEDLGADAVKKLGETLDKYIQSLVLLKEQAESGGQIEDLGKPFLDAPTTRPDSADLTVLMLKLRQITQEKQLEVSVNFIKTNKEKLQAQHEERVKKILEAAEKAEKAAKAGKIGKIFGWIATAIALVACIAACVATGGLALGPCVGAVMAVGMMVATETGAMDKLMEGLGNALKKMGIGEPAAQIIAAVIIMAAVLAVSCVGPGALSAGLSRAGAQVTKMAGQSVVQASRMASMAQKFGDMAKVVTTIGKGATAGTQIGLGVSGATGGYYQAKSLEAKADAKEIAKFLTKIKQQMEDEQDKIQELVEQMQENVSIVMNTLKMDYDTKNQILRLNV